MRNLYDIRRELVKYKSNLKEINRLILIHDDSIKLYKEKIKIKEKIKELQKELKEQLWIF